MMMEKGAWMPQEDEKLAPVALPHPSEMLQKPEKDEE